MLHKRKQDERTSSGRGANSIRKEFVKRKKHYSQNLRMTLCRAATPQTE
jgi:hypothetical protein